ncbi:MAG: efflux RND transporter periplasmic adaptor subunit [Syntrophothermus sp.]
MKKINIWMLVILFSVTGVFVLDGCSDGKQQGEKITSESHKDLYYCPMHPQVTSDKPGVCPICHMDLVKKGDNAADTSAMKDMVSLSKSGEIMANVAVTEVKNENIEKNVTAYGYLDFTEPGRKIVTARFNGRIEKLFVDASGRTISKGQPLFEIYSPDLVQAQNEFLIALHNSSQKATGVMNIMQKNDQSLLASSRKKLELMGVTEKQLRELESSGQVKMTLTYYSPYSGTVIEKKVQEGMYVNEGTAIYDIADMSVLWNVSEIFAEDISMVKQGDIVKIRTSSYPGEEFPGKVIYIYPVVNAETRTIKVRTELHNSGNRLKPQMYTETVFRKNYGSGLVVPENAVIFTGNRNIVWLKTGDGMFAPREIKTGVKNNGYYQVLSGLNAGDQIAATGSYLIDSESQLKGGSTAAGHSQHGGSAIPQQQPSEKPKQENEHSKMNHTSSIWNEVCPVLGNKVDPKVQTVDYKGKKIGFCCAGCDSKFKADPDKYMANLSPDGKKFSKNN